MDRQPPRASNSACSPASDSSPIPSPFSNGDSTFSVAEAPSLAASLDSPSLTPPISPSGSPGGPMFKVHRASDHFLLPLLVTPQCGSPSPLAPHGSPSLCPWRPRWPSSNRADHAVPLISPPLVPQTPHSDLSPQSCSFSTCPTVKPFTSSSWLRRPFF